jgi:hypothetical protein
LNTHQTWTEFVRYVAKTAEEFIVPNASHYRRRSRFTKASEGGTEITAEMAGKFEVQREGEG